VIWQNRRFDKQVAIAWTPARTASRAAESALTLRAEADDITTTELRKAKCHHSQNARDKTLQRLIAS
jgi:hypothetical protein